MAGAAAGAAFRSEFVDEIDRVLASACAASDLADLDDHTLSGVVLALERAQARLDAIRASAAAELDAREATVDEWGLRSGSWIAARTHTPPSAAKRRVHVSGRLRNEFPALLDALADGKISWFHVDVFCRAANPRISALLALVLPELIELAAGLPYSGWCAELRRVVARLDLDGGHDPAGDVEENRVFLSRTFDGTHELRGRLVGAWGASFAEMLERATDRQYRQHKKLADATHGETALPPRATLRALALLDLCRQGIAADPAQTTAPVTDLTLTHHHEGDRAGEDGPSPGEGQRGPRSTDWWTGGSPDGCNRTGCADAGCDREYTTTTGQVLSESELGCRLCDPAISLLRLDGNGLPLDLQRSQRLASAHQRRAVAARDRHCRFPGCDCPITWCDVHHILLFSSGGPTDIVNLVALCRFHHGITHRQGWMLTADSDDGTLTWTTPSGRMLVSPVPSTRAGPLVTC